MKKPPFFLKNYRVMFLLSSIAIVIVCCKTTQPVTTTKASTTTSTTTSSLAPIESDVAIAQAHWPGTTLDSLNRGYSIYADKCVRCHSAKRPQDFTVYAWNTIMHVMGHKARLDSDQYELVLHYILTKREAILGAGK